MRWASLASIAALVFIAPESLAAWGMPEAINERMQVIESIYLQLLVVGTIVFLVVFGWLGYNLVKYRPGGDGEPSYEEHRGSLKAEAIWTLIPILIVVWIGFLSFDGMQVLREQPEDPAAEIQIEGFQWFWQAHYGEDVSLAQQPGERGSLQGEDPFLIPANEPVVFNVTSGDVQHAFAIPELGVKADAYPQETNHVSFTAPEGEYLIQCAELCGNPGHGYMRAKLHAVPMEEYEDWLQERQREAQFGGQAVEVNVTSEGLQPQNLSAVAGVPTNVVVNNQADEARSLTIEDVENGTTDDIEPGESQSLQVTLEAGEYTVNSQGDTATLTAREVETVSVDLDEWSVEGEVSEFQAGETYLLEVNNVGNSVHNLYIGAPEEEAGSDEVLWQTENIDPGESTTLLIEPTQAQTGDWTWWCDIAGHYAQGMRDDVRIVE